jgi:hypothetical protein
MVAVRCHATNEQRAKILKGITGPKISGAFVKTTQQHRSTVYRWKKREEEVLAAAAVKKKSKSIVDKPRGPKSKFEELQQRYVY